MSTVVNDPGDPFWPVKNWPVIFHNFVAIAPMITKFGTVIKIDVFYTMATKIVTSLHIT